ncbi:hypothetical protein BCEN4_740093 [Burkholderia cenocepacia]|uniref:hypothetical protein n=1 Tax=Burkholderia cenocepacia TaxID=95486 RepID=UPI00192BAFB6|nr:hypothetical protein [Burkholderia cenocepacia]CAD9227973.1 hypothetical protein BCEN4_740093 [Burkholderia cenocepacia]
MIQTATNPHYNYLVSHGLYFDIELIGEAETDSLGTYQNAKMYLVVAGDRLDKHAVEFNFKSNGEDRKALMLEAHITKEWTALDNAMRKLLMVNQKHHTEAILDDYWSIRKYRTYCHPSMQK